MFCYRCGGHLQRVWLGAGPAPATSEIAPACRACGYIHYEGPAPVAGAIVRRGDEVLLARPHGISHHALISGLVKNGESIEEAAVREVFEETGFEVNVAYALGSYGVPGRNIVLVACVADVVGGEFRLQVDELAGVAWFHLDALPAWPAEWPLHRVFADYRARGSSLAAIRASSDVSPNR